MTAPTFEPVAGGGFTVSGRLGFETVHLIWELSRAGLESADEPSVDLGGVIHIDSAGLALVLEWVGWARARGKRLRLSHVPPKLLDLARISEVDGFLMDATTGAA